MSEFSTKEQHPVESLDLGAEVSSSSPSSGAVPTEESLDQTTSRNSSIASSLDHDDEPLDLRTTPVKTRNTLLQAVDRRTSQVSERKLVDIVDTSTTFPTRTDKHDATEETSACSDISDPCMITDDDHSEFSVPFPTGNDDRSALGSSNTISPPQFPVSTSCNIAGELYNAAHVGGSLGTSTNSPSVVQAQTTTNMTYKQQTFESLSTTLEKCIFWENLHSRNQSSTSQAVNVIPQPNTTVVGYPRFNMAESQSQRNQTCSTSVHGTLLQCSGNMDPGVVHLDEIYDSFTGERLFECDSCGSQYKRNRYVNRHFQMMHKNKNQPTWCNVCGDFHTGEKPFKCEHCVPERRFFHKKDIEWHYRVHFDNRPFRCHSCDLGFWNISLWGDHIPAPRQ